MREKFCYPTQLPDFVIALIMPPLYVIIHEYRKGFADPFNIFKNLILTSMFYFQDLCARNVLAIMTHNTLLII